MRYVTLQPTNRAIRIIPQHSGTQRADSWSAALTSLSAYTPASKIAIAAYPPEIDIQVLTDVENVPAHHIARTGRLRAIAAGYDDQDDIRVFSDGAGSWYYAALRRTLAQEILRTARRLGQTVQTIEHAAYAWEHILPKAQSVFAIRDGSYVDVVSVGNHRVELRSFEIALGNLKDSIGETIRDAERHGFISPQSHVGVIGTVPNIDDLDIYTAATSNFGLGPNEGSLGAAMGAAYAMVHQMRSYA